MCLDENNQRVLGNVLGIKSSGERANIYQKYFRRQFTTSGGMLNLVEREQIGGDPKQVQINIDGIDYIFTINEVDGELISVNGRKYIAREIYFFSLFSDSLATSCIWLTVNPRDKTGYVNGIAKRFQCIGFSSGRGFPMEPLVGKNQGALLIQALVKFCRFHAERLGIARLELGDIAERECEDKDGVFLISESNMLLGREPYYMKFGFRPVERSAASKIAYNLRKMKVMRIDSWDIIEYLEHESSKKVPTGLMSALEENDGNLAIELLTILRNNECGMYAKWYSYFYKYYGLKVLLGRENTYELIL